MQETIEIPSKNWTEFFEDFTKRHETDMVSLEVMGAEIGAQVEGRALLFGGISIADARSKALALMFDSVDGEHLSHTVERPTHVWLQSTPDIGDQALEIESADGGKTLVRFSSDEHVIA
jgi:uncharacterized protein DUF5335